MDEVSKKDPQSLIYLDETGIDDNETYPYAWGLKGPRIYAMRNANRKKRLSVISAIHHNQHIAPFVFEGSCDRSMFEAYVENILVPVLQPGQTLILDNASFHKGGKIKTIIEKVGCELLYLPPYSPDFNPIEHHWASIKHRLRQHLPYCDRDLYSAAQKVFKTVPI